MCMLLGGMDKRLVRWLAGIYVRRAVRLDGVSLMEYM